MIIGQNVTRAPPLQRQTPTSSGKGDKFSGTCYSCGLLGHRATDCRRSPVLTIDDEREAVMTVWPVGKQEARDVLMIEDGVVV
eukprot:12362230-Heterocapsa_arctica.AAC.1